MTDCDCFSKNCKRQFATVKSDHLISAGSPPSPTVIFTDPPASPPEAGEYSEMVLQENEVVADEAATQPSLTIYEPEVAIDENQEVYRIQYEDVSDAEDENLMSHAHDDRNSNHHPETVAINDGSASYPEVITIDDEVRSDVDGVAQSDADGVAHSDADESRRRRASSVCSTEPCKKIKMECDRPDTPRPVQVYSDDDERALQMYQDKLLRESLAAARNTYVSLTDLLLYKLRVIDFNSETPKDMLASLKVLVTLNRLYRAANLELDRHRQDEYGAEFFHI